MGIMVHSLSWVMQDLYHPPYLKDPKKGPEFGALLKILLNLKHQLAQIALSLQQSSEAKCF